MGAARRRTSPFRRTGRSWRPGGTTGSRRSGTWGSALRQRADGKVEAVSSTFTFSKLTGLAEVKTPDGTVLSSWQCNMLTSPTSQVLGWAWPTIMQADLPAPDVNVTDAGGAVVGNAYGAPIAGYWDVPVSDLGGTVTHYVASVMLPDATYVSVSNLAGTHQYYILAP